MNLVTFKCDWCGQASDASEFDIAVVLYPPGWAKYKIYRNDGRPTPDKIICESCAAPIEKGHKSNQFERMG